jgi:hypothetical protein
MTNDTLPDRLAGFLAPPYDDGKRLSWDLCRDGARRLVVSEGRMLLAVEVPADAPGWLPASTERPPPDPWSLLDAPAAEGTRPLAAPVAALLAWCGPEPAAEEVPCDACSWTGKCVCPCCDDTHDCKQCKGTGRAPRLRDPLHGRLLGQRVDRHRLRRLLSRATGQCVVTLRHMTMKGQPHDFLRVDGDGWTACLMPLVESGEPCPAYPEATCPPQD